MSFDTPKKSIDGVKKIPKSVFHEKKSFDLTQNTITQGSNPPKYFPNEKKDSFVPKPQRVYSAPRKKNILEILNPYKFIFMRVVIAATVVVFIGNAFGKTQVEIIPHKQILSLDDTFNLYKNPKKEQLGFDIIVIEDTVESTLANVPLVYGEGFSTGAVRLYNYTETEQGLAPRTRIENSDKKIFYLPDKNITIPAGTLEKPGVIDVDVVAEQVGEDYNIQPQRFTFPGFDTSSDKKNQIYAESLNSFIGGFKGNRPQIEEASLSEIKKNLEIELKNRLTERLSLEKTDEFFLVEGSEKFELSDVVYEQSESQTIFKKTGKIFALLVGKELLGNYVTKNHLKFPENQNFEIISAEKFHLKKKSLGEFDYYSGKDIQTLFTGDIVVESRIDTSFFEKELFLKDKKEVMSFIQNNPEVDHVRVIISPFWKKRVHADASLVKINLQNTE